MSSNFIISDEKKFNILKEKLILGGFSDLFIIADFDRTITKCFVNGKMVSSLASILRIDKLLSTIFLKESDDLFNQFHPFEISHNLSIGEKMSIMEI